MKIEGKLKCQKYSQFIMKSGIFLSMLKNRSSETNSVLGEALRGIHHG